LEENAMKITDPDVIKSGEKDLIEAVKEDIDWDAVKDVIKEQMEISSFSAEGGGILVHNNRIAFKIDFNLSFKGSLMFDREGNYISSDAQSVEPAEPFETAETGAEEDFDPQGAGEAGTGDPAADEADTLNEDIDDILKESREFWEKGGE
jgi:hypothetical protein